MTDELTPRQVAEALGVTPRTVQRWIATGQLAGARVGGRIRVSRSSLPQLRGETLADQPARAPSHRIASLLIANRGEIVTRVARTARRLGIHAIGVKAADDRPPHGVDEVVSVSSYLDGAELIAAARSAGSDAVHPGYGFLAENPAFARAVTRAGLTWVGPPAGAIAAMGDKASARQRAAGLGIPVVPGYDGPEQDFRTLAAEAQRIGYPVLVKPSAGGGGKGMRLVREPSELADSLAASRREAERGFGDDRLILERYLEGPRHVEIQVLFDRHGHGVHLGERDCSAQRRSQKIVEEAPAPSVSESVRDRMGAAAVRLAAGIGYEGVGTVEFVLTDEGSFFFLEMNTRLQVEHPVTEAITGRDLVEDQLLVAQGLPLATSQRQVHLAGHAIEARLYAEDPDAGFLPATGPVLTLRWPNGPGIRIDAGVREGDVVSDRYDPMLAKLVAHGKTRAEALNRLRDALDRTVVLGVRTNIRFLRWLLAQAVVRDGAIRTDTIAHLELPAPAIPDEAAWRAAASALLVDGSIGQGPWGGGWRANAPATVRLRHGDEERRVELRELAGQRLPEIAVAGGVAFVEVDGQSLELTLATPPSVEDAVRHAATALGRASLTAPMPGRVIAVHAVEGQLVAEHAALIVIEAMKMEHAVTSPLAGKVTRVAVREGQQVQRGDLLAEVSA